MDNLILRPIKDFEGYFAGSDGFIYSTKKKGCKPYGGELHKLKNKIQTTGYYYFVKLRNKGKAKHFRVHRLICIAFHGLKSNNFVVSHKDGNWKNNKPENLCWETQKVNLNRRKEHGTDDIGFKNSRALIDKLTLNQIRKLLAKKDLTHEQIGKKFSVSRVFITKINNGHRYKGQ